MNLESIETRHYEDLSRPLPIKTLIELGGPSKGSVHWIKCRGIEIQDGSRPDVCSLLRAKSRKDITDRSHDRVILFQIPIVGIERVVEKEGFKMIRAMVCPNDGIHGDVKVSDPERFGDMETCDLNDDRMCPEPGHPVTDYMPETFEHQDLVAGQMIDIRMSIIEQS